MNIQPYLLLLLFTLSACYRILIVPGNANLHIGWSPYAWASSPLNDLVGTIEDDNTDQLR